MAFNLLSIGTDGYLCKDSSRHLIAIATRGYLGCPVFVPPVKITGKSGWVGYEGPVGPSIEDGKRVRFKKFKKPKKIKDQNDVLMAIIKTFIKCQDENIL